ncbi:hypothetical protein BJX99DRAFT_249704 [Aspergillus californicus]
MGATTDLELRASRQTQVHSGDSSDNYPATKILTKSTGSEDDEDASGDEDEDSNGDEYDDGDDENDTADSFPVHTQLQAIVKSIKNREITDWTKDAEVFRNQYLTKISEKTEDCILHLLMNVDDVDKEGNKEIAKAIKNIARYHPDLMTARNCDKVTPLGLFPIKILGKRKTALEKAIGSACSRQKENCLHLAVKKCLHVAMKNKSRDASSLLETIIVHATPDAINARDSGNWTPLHHAVNYQHSGESTLRIIQTLLSRAEPRPETGSDLSPPRREYALDAYVTWQKEDLSVYSYHMRTRNRAMSRMPAGKPNRATGGRDAPHADQSESLKTERQTQNLSNPMEKPQRMNSEEKANIIVTRKVGESTEEAGGDDFLKPGLARANTFQLRTGGKSKRASSTDNRRHNTEQEGEQLESWSEKIRNELKLHCLRTRTSAQAERFLYGSNKEDIQLYFNYNGLPAENADPVTFYDNFKQTRFDEVLQYVEFPALRLRKTEILRGETFQQHKELFHSKSSGRKDLLFFFSWLKDKNVKHIINLVVRDVVDPHGDDAIEACLSGICVDSLDWSKPDLDPEMLRTACPDIKELHLAWGGNNAILRAWAEPEGLRTLAKLEQIYVYHDEHKACNSRSGPEASSSEAIIEEHATVTVHKWLESVDAFSEQLKTLMVNIHTNSHKGDEIRVALIDDGVDMCEKVFREKIMQGKSFAYYQPGNRREKQWYVSELGHGTVMAHMILRVCPMAKIYPIKLGTIRDPKKKHWDIQADSAVKAISAAVEKNVHIISMSWTIEKPKGDDKLAFDRALQRAEDEGILMFCSSPDDGIFSSDHYPTAWGADKFFRIGASQADGNPYSRVSPSQVDYFFPGVDVVRANKRDISLRGCEDHNSFTGSSISTALAAGLAALVLWFGLIGAKYSQDENQMGVLDSNDVKKLQCLGAGRDSNDKFVEIWLVLEKAAQTLKEHRGHDAEDIKESRRTIFNLARDMVSKS